MITQNTHVGAPILIKQCLFLLRIMNRIKFCHRQDQSLKYALGFAYWKQRFTRTMIRKTNHIDEAINDVRALPVSLASKDF